MPKNGENFKFPIADGTVKLFGGDPIIRKCNLILYQPEGDEEFRDDLPGESDGSPPLDALTDDREARNDFWIVITSSLELKKEIFPIPLRYIDVIRRTHTTLDVLQESQIDDYWNFHCDRNLSDSWTGVTVLSDNCESGNNHRYAVVVQDLATQWLQSYPCQSKSSLETDRQAQSHLHRQFLGVWHSL